MNPFDPNYRSVLKPVRYHQTAEASMRASLRRSKHGSAFDRKPINLSTTPEECAKQAAIKTPSAMRPKVKEAADA